jgi:hypothetical protein
MSNVRADDYEWSWTGQLILRDASDWDGVVEHRDEIIDALVRSSWYDSHPDRSQIVITGILETGTGDAEHGLCGDAAYHKYNVAPGDEWCSEFARTTLLAAGASPKACNGSHCVGLSEDLGVSDLEAYFRQVGGWTAAGYITTGQVQAGDYIALNTHGDTGNHSGIIMAIANNYKYIWTAEGNVTGADGDCVYFMRRPFLLDDGSISGDIYGIGNADKMFP